MFNEKDVKDFKVFKIMLYICSSVMETRISNFHRGTTVESNEKNNQKGKDKLVLYRDIEKENMKEVN